MRNDWFIDSNVVVKWGARRARFTRRLRRPRRHRPSDRNAYVLDFATVEVNNVIWVRYHRKLISLAEAQQSRQLLAQLPVTLIPALPHLDAAFDIAAKYDVAVYDALFVAATRALNLGGVTADEPLVQAVGQDFPEIVLLKNWSAATP